MKRPVRRWHTLEPLRLPSGSPIGIADGGPRERGALQERESAVEGSGGSVPDADGSLLYFAYGSNLNPARMRERGVDFRARAPACLPGWRLEFNKVASSLPRGAGYANAVPDPGSCVEGAVYHVERAHLTMLDAWEGYPDHYRRQELQVRLQDGSWAEAMVYTANPLWTRRRLRPTREYLNHLLAGQDVMSKTYAETLAATPVFEDLLLERRSGGKRRSGRRRKPKSPRGVRNRAR